MLLTVKIVGHEIGSNSIKRIQSKTAAIQPLFSRKTKIDLKMFIGSINFSINFRDKLTASVKPLYKLLLDVITFHWNNELETRFQQIKTSITKDVTLTIPKTNHTFFVTVDSSLIGIGCA